MDLRRLNVLLEEYKHLDKIIRENQRQENDYLKLSLSLLGGLFLSSAKLTIIINPVLHYGLLLAFPLFFLPPLALRISYLKEIYVSGGYKKAIEDIINRDLGEKTLLWEGVLVPNLLRSNTSSFVFYFVLIFLPLVESIYLYLSAYNLAIKLGFNKSVSLLTIGISFFTILIVYLLLWLEYKKSSSLFKKAYFLAFRNLLKLN